MCVHCDGGLRQLAEADHAVEEVKPGDRGLVLCLDIWYVDHLHMIDAQVADLGDVGHDLESKLG